MLTIPTIHFLIYAGLFFGLGFAAGIAFLMQNWKDD